MVELRRGLRMVGHPNIASMVDELTGAAATHAILEYCGGGSLEYHMTRLRKRTKGSNFARDEGQIYVYMSEEQAAPLVRQMGLGLAHLHDLGVAHRDLKPGNMLFDESRQTLKLCDFGFAIRCGNHRLKDRVGTLIYKAPELCECQARGSGYLGRPVDLWALGAVVYELLHNKHCYHGNTHQDIETRICKPDGYQDLRRNLSPAAKSLVLGLLVQEPGKRMSAHDVLAHGWLQRCSPVPLPAPTTRDGADLDDDDDEEEEEDDDDEPNTARRLATVEAEAKRRDDEWMKKFKSMDLDSKEATADHGGNHNNGTPSAGDAAGVPSPPQTPKMTASPIAVTPTASSATATPIHADATPVVEAMPAAVITPMATPATDVALQC